jgi:hypothetical protein
LRLFVSIAMYRAMRMVEGAGLLHDDAPGYLRQKLIFHGSR